MVHYSLTFEVGSKVSSSEGAPEAPPQMAPPPATSWLREAVTTALREEATLPIDLLTLNFEPGTTHTKSNKKKPTKNKKKKLLKKQFESDRGHKRCLD